MEKGCVFLGVIGFALLCFIGGVSCEWIFFLCDDLGLLGVGWG